jgi:uncharacterized protein
VAKFLLLIAVFAVAWWLVRRALRTAARRAAGAPPPPEDMVRCAQCGVHLPRSECMAFAGKLYCSEEHARLNG